MIRFKKKKRRLILVYTPETNDGGWVGNKLRTDGNVSLSRIFDFEREDLISPKTAVEIDFEDHDDAEELRFRFGTAEGNYYLIPGKRLGIDNNVMIAREGIVIERKTFVAERNINIFRRLAKLKEDGSPIIIGGKAEGAMPAEMFADLLDKFPNTTELNKYASARLEAIVGDVLMPMQNAREAYERYLGRRSSTVQTDILDHSVLLQSEIDKYVYFKEIVADWLSSADDRSEADWQKLVVKIILLLFPKYVAVLNSVSVADFYSEPGTRKKREIDLCLVDAAGNLDVIEIKKPFKDAVLAKSFYRDNYVPTRELTGCVVQTEKYLFHLSKWGVKGEHDITKAYQAQLPPDLKIRITNPKGIIIMGRDPESRARKGKVIDPTLDFEVIKRQYSNVMDIITYDDLLRRLDRIIASLQHRLNHNQ